MAQTDQTDDFDAWLRHLARGDNEAVQRLWQQYYAQLVRLARSRLGRDGPQRVVDGSDVALSALNSFYEGVAKGRFPRLSDPDDLWKLLVTIAVRKCGARRRSHFGPRRHPRGGRLQGESALARPGETQAEFGWASIAGREPTPEFVAVMTEEYERLLAVLAVDKHDLCRIALLKLENYTNEEIAQAMDCSLRTVKRRLSMIRNAWRAETAQ